VSAKERKGLAASDETMAALIERVGKIDLEKRLERSLGEIDLHEGETGGSSCLLEVGLLLRPRVVVREGVDSDHFVPTLNQRVREV